MEKFKNYNLTNESSPTITLTSPTYMKNVKNIFTRNYSQATQITKH